MKRPTTTTHTGGAKKSKIDAEPNKNEMEKQKKMSIEERKQNRKSTMKKVKYEGYADYREAKNTAEMITAKDQLLMRRVNRQPTQDCDLELAMAQARKVVFQIASTLHPEKNIKTELDPIHNVKETNETMLKLLSTSTKEEFIPPLNRILITPNITRTNNPVPVYCDLGKSLEDTEIPDTFIFDYITKNECDMNMHPLMKDFYAESQDSSNRVSCNCTVVDDTDSNGNICLCSKNNCPCARVNAKFQQMQKKDSYREKYTKINTSSELKISDFDDFYDTFGFNCSEACACKGRCNNNASYILQKNVHKLELSRSGPKGFGVRTRTFIPAYTPVLEFVGEISPYDSIIESGSLDYSLLLHHKEDEIVKLLKRHTGVKFSTKFTQLMENVWKKGPKGKEYFINPKHRGNLGRFFSHSCLPNLAQVRIFTESFTPAHMKVVLVSTQDIYPGEELTFSYGPEYIRDHLRNGGCLCGTIPCLANKNFNTFKDANYATLRKYFQERHQEQYLKFKKYLIDGDEYIPPPIEMVYEESSDSEAKNAPEEQEDDEVVVDEEQNFEVENILKHQYKDNGIHYLVKWLNYPSSENSWVKERDMHCDDVLKEYWLTNKATKIEEQHRKTMAGSLAVPEEMSRNQNDTRVEKPMRGNRSQLELGREVELVLQIRELDGIRSALLKYVGYNALEWVETSYVSRVQPQALIAFYEKLVISM